MLATEAHHRPTQHYKARVAKRALHPDVEEFLMTWGTETRAAGATHFTLVRRELPVDLRDSEAAVRAEGWVIVASNDGALITCYRRHDAWRFVRLKSENRLRPRQRKAA